MEKRHKVAVQKSTISAASLCATLPTTPFLIQLEEFAEVWPLRLTCSGLDHDWTPHLTPTQTSSCSLG